MDGEVSWRIKVLNAVAGLVLLPLTPFAILCFWNWFGLPLGLPKIDFAEAWGIALAIGLVAIVGWTGDGVKGASSVVFIAKLVGLALTIVLGFAVHYAGHLSH